MDTVYKQGWSDERKILKKVSEIMQRVKYIQKTGYNKQQGYKYTTEGDIVSALQDELSSRYIVIIPNTKSHHCESHETKAGGTMYIDTIEIEWTLMDGETGESISFTLFGKGQDSLEKGIYKAVTGSQKYALMKFFMIETGEDPGTHNLMDDPLFQNQVETSIMPSLKAKWQTLSPTKDLAGFEAFYQAQKTKGFSDEHISEYLANKIISKMEDEKSNEALSNAELKKIKTTAEKSGFNFESDNSVSLFMGGLKTALNREITSITDIQKNEFAKALKYATGGSAVA